MPKFITIGYGDQAGYDRTPAHLRETAHAHDAELVSQGAIMGIAGLPVQVRNPQARGVETESGPYLSANLPIAGFGVLNAESIEEAIVMASKSPCAIAYGVIEVWPLRTAE